MKDKCSGRNWTKLSALSAIDRIFIANAKRSGLVGTNELVRLYGLSERYVLELSHRQSEEEKKDIAKMSQELVKNEGTVTVCKVCEQAFDGGCRSCPHCGALNTDSELNSIASFIIHFRNLDIDSPADGAKKDNLKLLFCNKQKELYEARTSKKLSETKRKQELLHVKHVRTWSRTVPNAKELEDGSSSPIKMGRPRSLDVAAEREILAKISALRIELPIIGSAH